MLIDADHRETPRAAFARSGRPPERLRRWRVAALVLVIGLVPMLAGSTYLQLRSGGHARQSLDRELTNAAQVEARALSAYFERAATVISLAAADPDLAADSTPARGASARAERRRIERSLAYIARIYPRGSIGRISFVDAHGTELARLEGGEAVSPRRLSQDLRRAPYFAPTMRLRGNQAFQTEPYLAEPGGQWVISSSAPVGARDGHPSGLVRFELRLESFRLVAAQLVPEHDTLVVDRRSGRTVLSSRRVVMPHAPLASSADRPVARSADGEGMRGLADVRDEGGDVVGRAAYSRLGHVPSNANDWAVVVSADPASVVLSSDAVIPFAIMALALLLVGVGLARYGNVLLAMLAQTVERAGEKRLDAVARNSSDVVTVLGADGVIHVQTGATAETLGYLPEELEGTRFDELVHPDDRDAAAAFLGQPAKVGRVPRRAEWRLRHGDGSWRYVETIATALAGDDAFAGTVLTSRDIGARKQLEDQLRHRAFHDPLTQLPNRALFYDRIGHALARKRRPDRLVGVLFVDVDDFKLINDRYGHAGGDEVLVGVAQRLRGALRSADTVARFGGDEFGVLLEDIDGKGEAENTAERILSAFREPLILHGEQVFVKPSVGVALGEPRVSGVEEVLRRADIAMYAAKRGGKGCFQLFDEKLDVTSAMEHDPARGDDDRLTWFVRGEEQREQIVAVLAADDSITTVFQPLVDLRTGVVVGYEALSRFKDPDRRPPNAWFAQAARCGLGTQLEARALEVALAGARHRPRGTYVSLNLSPSSLMAEEVVRVLPQDLTGIVIEITENELLFGGERLSREIAELRGRGARIAIDDAGAGYAGLKHLMLLQPDIVKLDRGLVEGISDDAAKQALIDAFVRFAREIGADVCAEGIESIADLVVLADLDVAIGQGYVVGRPAEQFTHPQVVAVKALRDATAAAQRFGASETSRPAFVADRHLELAAERLGAVSSAAMLGPALKTIADALQADGICVSRLIGGGSVIKTVATFGLAREGAYYSLDDYPATALVIDTGEAMQVIDGDPKADRIELEELRIKGRLSLLMVPILSDGVGIGVLEAFASERRPWSRLGLARARLFAYQLGLLLDKLATKEAVGDDDHLAETRAALRAIGSIPVGERKRTSA